MKEKIPFLSRLLLIVICACVAGACILKMNETYDPLARYSYGSEEDRQIILKYLNEDDIDYLITQKIRPEQFLDFIDNPEFNIHNTIFYSAAKKIQNEENDFIVNFINKYRDRFSLEECKDLLEHYSYEDLIAFYEVEQSQVDLVLDPSLPFTTLNLHRSIYKYEAENLVDFENIVVRKEMVSQLQEMQADYQRMMNDSDRLDLLSGYMSYEDVMSYYVFLQNKYGEAVNRFLLPSGHNEQQLGFTIILQEAQDWNHLCVQEKTYENFDYSPVYSQLSAQFMDKLNWIKNNAYQYGFVVRYPEGKEDKTEQEYQPFVLRYVGINTAKKMFESGKVLEEMKGLEEIE